jgi:hypothetical protein
MCASYEHLLLPQSQLQKTVSYVPTKLKKPGGVADTPHKGTQPVSRNIMTFWNKGQKSPLPRGIFGGLVANLLQPLWQGIAGSGAPWREEK